MEKRELELRKKLDVKSAAAYIEKLAKGIRQGEVSIEEGTELLQLSPSQDLSLEVKTKVKKGKVKFGLSLSWNVKSVEPQDDIGSEGAEDMPPTAKKKEKYKKLKNRMSDDLSAIHSSVVQKKSLPDSEVFERFCIDARAMCTYRKKGEPYYESFLERLETFGDAYEANNLSDVEKALDSLIDMKDRCHEEYK